MRPNSEAGPRVAVGVILLWAAAGAAAGETIRPGYWESTNEVTSPIHSTKTERRCVTPKDVATFMTCHINHHYRCVCPVQTYSGGKIEFRGDCLDAKGGRVHIEGEGAYTPTTLHMTARGNFKFLGAPITFAATTTSHRIADACPPGAKGSDEQGK